MIQVPMKSQASWFRNRVHCTSLAVATRSSIPASFADATSRVLKHAFCSARVCVFTRNAVRRIQDRRRPQMLLQHILEILQHWILERKEAGQSHGETEAVHSDLPQAIALGWFEDVGVVMQHDCWL